MTAGDCSVELTADIRLEEGSYWADVRELPGCFASGNTLDELFDSLLEGVRLYLDDGNEASSKKLPAPSLQVRSAVLSDASGA